MHLLLGQRCVANDAPGIIRFIGVTNFSPGVWVGVELDKPDGKNNGSVQGIRYFECGDNHGIFVRESKVVPLHKADKSGAGRQPNRRETQTPSKLQSERFETPSTPSRVSRVSTEGNRTARKASRAPQQRPSNAHEFRVLEARKVLPGSHSAGVNNVLASRVTSSTSLPDSNASSTNDSAEQQSVSPSSTVFAGPAALAQTVRNIIHQSFRQL